jgi:hypothetical protein
MLPADGLIKPYKTRPKVVLVEVSHDAAGDSKGIGRVETWKLLVLVLSGGVGFSV